MSPAPAVPPDPYDVPSAFVQRHAEYVAAAVVFGLTLGLAPGDAVELRYRGTA